MVSTFLWLSAVLDWAYKIAAAILQGAALGFGNDAFIQQVGRRWYSARDQYFNEKYNKSGLFNWEKTIVEKYFQPGQRIFVWAAGGGREILALSDAGMMVDGCEYIPSLVETANSLLTEAGSASRVVVGDIDDLPANLGKFDHVILGWGGYTHVITRERRIRLLKDVAGILVPSGTLTLSFWTRAGLDQRFHAIARVANVFRKLLGRESVEVGDTMMPLFGHCFSRREVEAELAGAGLELKICHEIPYGHVVAMFPGNSDDRVVGQQSIEVPS